MNSLIFSVNATMPIFLIMIIGWVIRRVGIIDESFTIKANDYVFKIGLPVLLFKDLNSVDFHNNFSFNLLIYCCYHRHGRVDMDINGDLHEGGE